VDRANPSSDDPVERESSHVECVAANDTQSFYDCNRIKETISGPAFKNGALLQLFDVTPEDYQSERALDMFYSSSGINHATQDAPPTCVSFYRYDMPMTEDLSSGDGIHDPVFGRLLKEKMDSVGVRCDVYYREDVEEDDEDIAKGKLTDLRLAFIKEHLL